MYSSPNILLFFNKIDEFVYCSLYVIHEFDFSQLDINAVYLTKQRAGIQT
jgi:hypothetical protein